MIIGAGVSGLATAAALEDRDYLVLERDAEVGGYCKTVKRDGFVWDYSGHFFHFKRPEVEQWLRARMGGQAVRTVQKRSFISYAGRRIDFPFQKNIHQLPQGEFIDCLYDLYFAQEAQGGPEESFRDMLYRRFGRSISEKFLIPYNEKLYATDLARLDKDAMGRFFPHANLTEIIRNMRAPDNASYNQTFTYPEGGAIEYVKALQSAVRPEAIRLSEPVTRIDLQDKVAYTPKGEIWFENLISSAPFPTLLRLCGVPHDAVVFSWNKVLVFNLGFDAKGERDVHWVYFPDRALPFYRVGWYDNIFDADRMSLYVELGFPSDAEVDAQAWLPKVLGGLRAEGIVTTQKLVAHHSVVMDPAYVHITQRSIAEHRRFDEDLRNRGVYSIGRYGGWTYCAIEDNIVEARALAARL